MIIRKATAADVDAVAKIYDEIHEEIEKGTLVVGWEKGVYPVKSTAQNALEKDWLFVAEKDGEIVSAAIINQYQGPIYEEADWEFEAQEHEVMVLHTLVVSPSCKQQGIGTQMVDFYEQYARKNNCPELRMDTNERNTVARKLYEKLGYKEVSIVPCVFNGIAGVNLVCLEKRL